MENIIDSCLCCAIKVYDKVEQEYPYVPHCQQWQSLFHQKWYSSIKEGIELSND